MRNVTKASLFRGITLESRKLQFWGASKQEDGTHEVSLRRLFETYSYETN